MRAPFTVKSLSRQSSKRNGVTILVFGVVFLVLGICGIGYWKHVSTQALHLQERNFRALTVTGRALGQMVAGYGTIFKSIIQGEPPCKKACGESDRKNAYEQAVLALGTFKNVNVAPAVHEDDGFSVTFVNQSIQLTCVNQDRTAEKAKWRITAVITIGTIMRQLVTEDIFPDLLLTDRMGKVLYHHQSTRDASGFAFKDVSILLRSLHGSEAKPGGADQSGSGKTNDLVPTLPLFSEASIVGISHAVFAQAADLPADRGAVQTLILVGLVPAGQFYAESRAIPLNSLLLLAGALLGIFFLLPYIKLRTTAPTERLTPVFVAVLIMFSVLGTAVLTFGLADFVTYRNLEQYLDRQLEAISKTIQEQFDADVRRGLQQLAIFDGLCKDEKACLERLEDDHSSHLAKHLCIRMNEEGASRDFMFVRTESDRCSEEAGENLVGSVLYSAVKTMFWVGATGELKVMWSREPNPWKYVNIRERQYVRRILEDETLVDEHGGKKFWIQPIYSLTTGGNSAVLSTKSKLSSEGQNHHGVVVAALEVKLPSVTDVGVPPGLGFAVIDQDGKVLFHSDSRRNLRENLFEETDGEGRLRQAVFARTASTFDGRYWGKDRHFHIAPLFRQTDVSKSPDFHWSLVTYWDMDILRGVNLRALYSSGALFFIYAVSVFGVGMVAWRIDVRLKDGAARWIWPRSGDLNHYHMVVGLLMMSLIAVGFWYWRPPSYLDMLLWALLPALAAAAVVWSVFHHEAHPTNKHALNISAHERDRLSYMLVLMLTLLTFVVLPSLVIFRVAMDVEWRLLAKFTLVDLNRDREIQAKGVREFYRPTLFSGTKEAGEVDQAFVTELLGYNQVYADFPFKGCGPASEDCSFASPQMAQRGDERLIRWLYHVIDRPSLVQSGRETDIFLEPSEQWRESAVGTMWFEDRLPGSRSPISLSAIPPPVPQWLYSLLIFGGVVPLVALLAKKVYVLAVSVCALGGLFWFGLIDETLAVLAVSAVLFGAWYVLPMFAAQRIALLGFAYPSLKSKAVNHVQEIVEVLNLDAPVSWPVGLVEVFRNELSSVHDVVCRIGIPWSGELTQSCKEVLKLEVKEDLDMAKRRIVREMTEALTRYYVKIWETCTRSQRRALFDLCRDGFLNSRNPDIQPLMKNGLIVLNLGLGPMNESFRRFIIKTGWEEGLNVDSIQENAGTPFQMWKPIGLGLLLAMVFLALTQEQYRTITLAFVGVLPGLLGAFSQALTALKKERGDPASSA